MKRLLGVITMLTLFPTTASAQDALCYMQWHGQTIDLSSSICGSQAVPNLQPLTSSKFQFSELRVESTMDGASLEIKGTLTNESNKTSTLSSVSFNVINQQTGLILTSDTAVVEAGKGIEPGEQLAFMKSISVNVLRENPGVSNLQIMVTGFI